MFFSSLSFPRLAFSELVSELVSEVRQSPWFLRRVLRLAAFLAYVSFLIFFSDVAFLSVAFSSLGLVLIFELFLNLERKLCSGFLEFENNL